jgi:His/Glu/Gln/Arg/opine family amino acid ABC transporter permease subunit
MLSLFLKYRAALLDGALTTLELAVIVWTVGLVVGTLLGLWRASQGMFAQRIGRVVGLALSSVPILVYLLWAYYPLQRELGFNLSPFATAAAVLSLYNSLSVSELVGGGIIDFPPALKLAAAVTGVPAGRFTREILLPIVLRGALPAYLASQVNALHLTLFASLISLDELFRTAQRINAVEYRAVDVFSLITVFYFLISFPLLLLSRRLQKLLFLPGMER